MRDYGPQPEIHDADCPDVPANLLRLSISAVEDGYPYARYHSCFSSETVTQGAELLVEHIDHPAHPYRPSAIRPHDATRALCGVCRGTHQDDV